MKGHLPTPSLAVLGYHHIGDPPSDWPSWYFVPVKRFEEHMRYLAESEWKAVSLAEVMAGILEPETLPTHSVLITFDDGSRSVREQALPVLERFGFPAVVFVPTDHIGGENQWDAGAEPPTSLCDWDDLRALSEGGIAVQAHGATHSAFSSLDESQIRDEVVRPKAVLEEKLERPVTALAFPFGDGGSDRSSVRRLLQEAGYQMAFGFRGTGIALPAADPFFLPRLAIGPEDNLRDRLGGGEQGTVATGPTGHLERHA